MKQYGVEFPDDWNVLMVELYCYNAHIDGTNTPQMLEKWQHLERAIKSVYTAEQFAWHRWTYRRLKRFCSGGWETWIGCGASGKSTDAAMFLYMHFLAGMDKTTIRVYSTTREMLRLRIWKDIVRFHLIFPNGLRYIPSEDKILYGDKQSTINGIFGQGVLRDNGEKAVANLVGVHNKRNLIVLDEMQGCPGDLIRSAANTITSGGFTFLGMGNITGRDDTLGKYAEPWDGWASVDENSREWLVRVGKRYKGYCVRFDGMDSPRNDSPAEDKRLDFLIGRDAIEAITDIFGEDSIEYWSQARGYPRVGMNLDTFLDYATVDRFNMTAQSTYLFGFKKVAGFDPAFTAGGDRPMISFAKVGIAPSGLQVISFYKTVHIKLKVTESSSITDILVRRVMEECALEGVKPHQLAIDCTGQETLADVLTEKFGGGIHRVHFGRKASEHLVSLQDKKKGHERFTNRVSELWHNFSLYARAGQIMGIEDGAIKEFTSRKSVLDPRNFKRAAETKDKMKARMGFSPDDADSKVLALSVVKEIMGIIPGSSRNVKKMMRRSMGVTTTPPRSRFRSRAMMKSGRR